MRLFQFKYSPYAAKVRIAAAIKKLKLELVEVPYVQRAELVKVSGGVGIPVLEDGAQVVTDSPRIVAYLDTKAGPALRADPLAMVLEQWADSTLEDACFRLACPRLEDLIGESQGEAARLMFRLVKERKYGAGIVSQWRADEAKWLAETRALLSPLAEAVQSRDWLLPSGLSVADLALAGQVHMLEWAMPGFLEREVPSLVAWARRLETFGEPVLRH